ncbi:hypothetical protein [Xanthomonas sp. GW]|uniref:hypothetical protein n=1 Tax=Xanthomonas sp. GW TaxID=2724121 RepID=UPI00163AD134|nr:hypothetical protein [Xanthomonas sp. GW]
MKYKHALIFMTALIAGCFGFVPFQPNRDQDEMWSATGKSRAEVQKAMLECGYPNLSSISGRGSDKYPSENEIAIMFRCMQHSGFTYGDEGFDFCKGYENIPACQPGAIIPKRDLGLRINSNFCKSHVNADACRP